MFLPPAASNSLIYSTVKSRFPGKLGNAPFSETLPLFRLNAKSERNPFYGRRRNAEIIEIYVRCPGRSGGLALQHATRCGGRERCAVSRRQKRREAEQKRRRAEQQREAQRKRRREHKRLATQIQTDWWIVLGVAPSASKDEIVRKYRHKVKQCHPDRLLGLAPELLELAEERTKALNGAYEKAMRARGYARSAGAAI